jgi:hypothetical protein
MSEQIYAKVLMIGSRVNLLALLQNFVVLSPQIIFKKEA